MSVQDVKKLTIDDRKNSFMLGATIMLFAAVPTKWWVGLALIAISIILTIFLTKFKVMGQGDINALRWNILGFGILGSNVLVAYLIGFVSVTLLYYLLKKLFKIDMKAKTAFIPVMGTVFLLMVYFFKLY
jgi:hypothetical protein